MKVLDASRIVFLRVAEVSKPFLKRHICVKLSKSSQDRHYGRVSGLL